MIDLNSLKKLIVNGVDFFIDCARKRINAVGFQIWFEHQLSTFLNCSKLSNNGHRLVQTNLRQYYVELTITITMIEEFAENKDYCYEKLLELHNNNLEYEAAHGFEYDPKIISKKKSSKPRSKQTSIDFGDKPKKETAAERKLKAHIAKINSLNIKIKPVRNDNTV